MKTLLFLAGCLLATAVTAGVLPAGLPEVVARINQTTITRADLHHRLAQSRSMNPQRFDAMTAAERRRAVDRVLDDMILRELQVQEARRRGLVVADADVERELAGLRRRYPTPQALEEALAESEITLAQWKEETRRDLLIKQLDRSIVSGIPVTEEEIRQVDAQNPAPEKGGPAAQAPAERRDELREIVRQRKWLTARKTWNQFLYASAAVWRWRAQEDPDADRTVTERSPDICD